jgi:hypothetical protein
MVKSYVTLAHREWLAGRRESIMDEEASERSIGNILTNLAAWQDGLTNSDVEFQVTTLGLKPADILGLEGQKVLDIGCGRDSVLVYWLRELGVDAEGIDPIVSGGIPFLMQQAVNGFSAEGRIPRADGHYKLVVAHLPTSINRGLSRIITINPNPPTDEILRGTSVVLECARVLAQDGRFVCWPGIGRTDYLDTFLRADGYVHRRETLFAGIPEEIAKEVGDAAYRSTIIRSRSS